MSKVVLDTGSAIASSSWGFGRNQIRRRESSRPDWLAWLLFCLLSNLHKTQAFVRLFHQMSTSLWIVWCPLSPREHLWFPDRLKGTLRWSLVPQGLTFGCTLSTEHAADWSSRSTVTWWRIRLQRASSWPAIEYQWASLTAHCLPWACLRLQICRFCRCFSWSKQPFWTWPSRVCSIC